MNESPAHPLGRRTSALHAWLRLFLAAFVFAVFTAGALSNGVARADDGPSDAGRDAGTSSSPAAQRSEPGSPGAGPTSGPKPGDDRHPGAAKPTGPAPGGASAGPDADVQGSHVKGPATESAGDAGAGEEAKEPTEPTQATDASSIDADTNGHSSSTVATTAPRVSRPEIAEDVPHGSKRSGNVSPSTATAAATVTAPQSQPHSQSVTVTPTLRSVGSTAAAEPVTPTVAAVTASPSVTTIQPRLDLQLAGLAVDVGTVTVSAVHTAATLVAQAFGPSSLLGVPYLLATTVANAAAAVGRGLVGAPVFEPTTGPFPVTYGILDGLAFFNPGKPPAGANDPSITVTPEHPLPIILLNGTTATQGANWSVGAPVLANAGYKVYTFNYGNTTADPNFPIQAVGDIRQSGLELAAEVNRVLAETGAPKVILIGHSQGGGILPVYYLNELGGAAKVSQLIGIAPSNHGTDFDGLGALQSIPILGSLIVGIADALGPALYQQALGSPFQQEVYGDGDTRPGVLYTTISSVDDEVVTPYTQQALTGPNVTNIILQQRFPGLILGHANIFTSPQAWASVLDALASNPAANPLPVQNTVAA
ncbi:alpha/beta fold hydrolase [Mycolicibacterium sp.]|uniref:alpha/beta fold hydrolase n=1 Tax=Mycolicibacterium sp. TaxID=2320850 RepID=UPI001A23742B|nr:alpha/beta fold hydrolase [Mycolicibacterium sp.]MBJ7339993.1 alpha/beta fold hydrolase [Mycolicibacterium sp.]